MKGIDDSYSVHYVTQEVELDEDEESMLPGEIVLRADLQRGLLLDEQARLESSEDATSSRLQEVNAKLDAIGAASAPARVAVLLKNLGFSEVLIARPMKALSGGWRVRTALAAALFAEPERAFARRADEPLVHLRRDVFESRVIDESGVGIENHRHRESRSTLFRRSDDG